MIQLPSNLTVALLAAALGLVLGLGGGYLLFHQEATSEEFPDLEGFAALERDRPISEEDTSGQSEPDVEIRYRTRTDTIVRTRTDTLRVPASLPSQPILSDRTPLQISADQVTHTYYDPREERFEQRLYNVPADRYRLSLYAVGLREWRPDRDSTQNGIGSYQVGLGVEAHLDPEWVPGAIEPFGEARTDFREAVYTGGLRWRFLQL